MTLDNREADYQSLVKPLEDQMIRTIWRIVHDPDDAEDAMQEALATMWRRFDRIGRHPNPRALILRICINAACDVLRRKQRIRKVEERDENFDEVREGVAHPSRTAREMLENEDLESQIRAAIDMLSPQQSVAVRMRLVERFDYGDIAEVLACSEATARTHVARGRHRLQEVLAHLAPKTFPKAVEA